MHGGYRHSGGKEPGACERASACARGYIDIRARARAHARAYVRGLKRCKREWEENRTERPALAWRVGRGEGAGGWTVGGAGSGGRGCAPRDSLRRPGARGGRRRCGGDGGWMAQ